MTFSDFVPNLTVTTHQANIYINLNNNIINDNINEYNCYWYIKDNCPFCWFIKFHFRDIHKLRYNWQKVTIFLYCSFKVWLLSTLHKAKTSWYSPVFKQPSRQLHQAVQEKLTWKISFPTNRLTVRHSNSIVKYLKTYRFTR